MGKSKFFSLYAYGMFVEFLRMNYARIVLQVFRGATTEQAMELTSLLLKYTPTSRISPLEACAHAFFDDVSVFLFGGGEGAPPRGDEGKFNFWVLKLNRNLYSSPCTHCVLHS